MHFQQGHQHSPTKILYSAPNSCEIRQTTPRTCFEHSSLDHEEPSIRLIRVLPETSLKGPIQCEIRHASTDSTYICLSYVWGREGQDRWITLNGKDFRVRDNLYHFLRCWRRNPVSHSQWLWIDALCINQENNSERTHQVQQMGAIFSQATSVISWLGASEQIAAFLADAAPTKKPKMIPPVRFHAFYSSDYWDRAWITQEVALARRITLMAKDTTLPFDTLPDSCANVGKYKDLLSRIDALRPGPNETSHLKGLSLVYLLDIFKLKKCQVPHDRVFSLLALCGDGRDVGVNYTIPRAELAYRVLNTCRESFCLCSTHIVCNALGSLYFSPRDEIYDLHPLECFAQITLPATKRTSSRTPNDSPASFTLDLSRVCGAAPGKLEIRFHASQQGFSCEYIDSLGFRSEVWIGSDCSVDTPKHGRSCTLNLTFVSLLYLVATLRGLNPLCCDRVASLGTSREKLRSEILMRLCTTATDTSG